MYKYDGLYILLKKNNLKKSDLTTLLNISSRTISKISRGEKISNFVIKKICDFFSCNEKDIYIKVSKNPILQRLKEEKENKISGGLYHEIQVRITFNSNHIEGSKLSEEETRMIFDTKTINTKDSLPVDDIIETINHFRAIDYCIEVAEEPLNEEIIKKIHYLLKRNTKAEDLSWFNIGDYKSKENIISGNETTKPENVSNAMKQLIDSYINSEITIKEIIKFHHDFESIHPFQDGNGRVGRLIAFKECLKYNIVPFIIEDNKKYYYYRGLREWENEPSYLIDTCLDGQDTFRKLLQLFNLY